MTRRIFTLSGLPFAAAVIGCNSESKPSATATLLNNDEVHSAMKNLIDIFQNMESDVNDFDTEDWRSVASNIKDGTAEMSGAIQQLKKALGYSDTF